MLSIIVAIAKNNVIGKDNKLIWHLPEDLKRFKKITTGHTIIMGRKTFESLGRVLPNRKHIVLCNDAQLNIDDKNVEIINSVDKLEKYENSENENFVIGGAMIYNLLMPYVKKLYVTEIHKDFEGDTFFQKINPEIWKEISRAKGPADGENHFEYDYVVYIRK